MAYLKTLLFYSLPPASQARRYYLCLCHSNVTKRGGRGGGDGQTQSDDFSELCFRYAILCLPLQKFMINFISKCGFQPLFSAIILKVPEDSYTYLRRHGHGDTIQGQEGRQTAVKDWLTPESLSSTPSSWPSGLTCRHVYLDLNGAVSIGSHRSLLSGSSWQWSGWRKAVPLYSNSTGSIETFPQTL